MAKYRPVYTKIWKDRDFMVLQKEAKLLFLYLITNESINNSGVYEIPLKIISAETGIGISTIDQLLTNGCIKNVVYDREHEVVFITNARKYSAGGNPAQVEKGILTEFTHLNKTPLWKFFLQLNPQFEKIFSTVPPTVGQPLPNGTLPLPLPIKGLNINKRNKPKTHNNDAVEVLEDFNLVTKRSRKYSPCKTNLDPILARLSEGYTVDELKQVSRNMASRWLGDPRMDQHLAPETIFRKSKIEKNLNAVPSSSKQPQTKGSKKLEQIKGWLPNRESETKLLEKKA